MPAVTIPTPSAAASLSPAAILARRAILLHEANDLEVLQEAGATTVPLSVSDYYRAEHVKLAQVFGSADRGAL